MQTILEAAIDLIDLGLPVVAADGKVPLGGKGWHQREFSPAEIEQLLSEANDPAIGIVLGHRSCLDIESDGPKEEALFRELFAGCDEPPTPTFQSTRGLHRLYQTNGRLEQTRRGIVHFRGHDGAKLAVRIGADGKGAQSIVPPARDRTWLAGRSIDDCEFGQLPEPVVDRILAAVTVPSHSRVECPADESIHDPQNEYLRVAKRTQKKSNIWTQPDTANSLIAMCPLTLEEAIAATLPSAPGFRNRQIFVFARYLRGMPDYRCRNVNELQSVVRKWHAHALPFIATKEFHETWKDFQNAWDRVQFPIWDGPLAQLVREALLSPFPEIAGRYENPDLQKLVAVCCRLQKKHSPNPFFLSCRDAAILLGGSATRKTRWNRYFHQLCADGVLKLHKTGSRGLATEFFYCGELT